MEKRTVADIMEKSFVTAAPDTSVFDLIDMMVEHNVAVIPIVRDDGALAGIVTEADLVYKKVKPHMSHYSALMGENVYYNGMNEYEKGYQKKMACNAKELMTTDVVVASPKATVEQIAGIMVSEHLKLIPVIDDNRLVGLVTRRHILNELYKEYNG